MNSKFYGTYKMIDFSKDEGELFLSIEHNIDSSENIRLQLRERKNKNFKIDLPIRKYGNYIELSININNIYDEFNINEEEIWDLIMYNSNDEVTLILDNFKSFMTDYYIMKDRIYQCKPYITGGETLALYIKKTDIQLSFKSLEKREDKYNLTFQILGYKEENIINNIKEVKVYFRRRGKKISENEFNYSNTLSFLKGSFIENNIVNLDLDFKEILKYEDLKPEKTCMDGFLEIVDKKGFSIYMDLKMNTNWKSKPYEKFNDFLKVCIFKNYCDAISICLNKI